MNGILLNMAFVTLVGIVILIIRNVWGEAIHPQVLKCLWILFFICALCPMSSADYLGRAATLHQAEDRKLSEIYSWHHEEYYSSLSTRDMDGMYGLCGTIIGMKIKQIFPIVWAVGFIITLLYKVVGVVIFYYKCRADYKYTLEPNVLEEKGISLSVPVRITENTGPMVLGALGLGIRPAIYMPERFLQGDESLFQSIILHEREHIARKHHLLLLLINLVGSVYWFLPYVEKIFFQALREDMEYRCDYELIRKHSVEAREYAKHCVAMAQDMGRLCNALSFGEGKLIRRVRYIQHNRKKAMFSLIAGVAAGVTVLVCAVGTAFYYKRDAQGFTRWEVEAAKETLIHYVDAVNSKDKERIDTWVSEDSRLRRCTDYLNGIFKGGEAIYGIIYEPDDWSYYHRIKWVSQENRSNHLFFEMNYHVFGSTDAPVYCEMVRADANSPWKVYDLYTG
ncbi:MAG: M56 family metallopeptidase [Butyrivibrio sp.]|nr:M56 family metallopeptidase [Muribaculum sp.]MCM1553611.1 M56 family metallopeptidase [Butyrivibrio sp.]